MALREVGLLSTRLRNCGLAASLVYLLANDSHYNLASQDTRDKGSFLGFEYSCRLRE